jgi:heparosan-N-sulfate-glucuronate 5-epimerase
VPSAETAHQERFARQAQGPAPLRKARQLAYALGHAKDDLLARGPYFTHQPLGRRIDPAGLGGYYCDMTHKGEDVARHADWMPRDNWGVADAIIPVANAALGLWDLHLEGRRPEGRDPREGFLALADWLLGDADEGGAWRTHIPVPKYGVEAGWASAMGQGLGISVLVRAHADTGRDDYLAQARAALAPMRTRVEDDGTQTTLDGHTVLEEYPADRPAAILNGWIFALIGLHELALATGDEEPRALFEESVAGLLELLPRYDTGWWSLYSLYDHGFPDLAKPFYQRLHPVLLDALNLIHPDPRLPATARRWEAQLTRRAEARVWIDKVAFRVRRAR